MILKRTISKFYSIHFWSNFFPLLLILLGLISVLAFQQQRRISKKQAEGFNSTVSLMPTTISPSQTNPFTIDVILNSKQRAIMAVDLVIAFDPSFLTLEAMSVYPQASVLKTFVPVNNHGVFSEGQVITQANQSGRIEFGAIAYDWASDVLTTATNGTISPFATLSFRAHDPTTLNETVVKVVYYGPGQSHDTNIITFSSNGVPHDNLGSPIGKTTISSSTSTTSGNQKKSNTRKQRFPCALKKEKLHQCMTKKEKNKNISCKKVRNEFISCIRKSKKPSDLKPDLTNRPTRKDTIIKSKTPTPEQFRPPVE